jgi:hypothetical protein
LKVSEAAPSDADEHARSTEEKAASPIDSAPMPESVSAPIGAQKSEPSDADLERAMVAAMLDGRGAVAETLAEMLKTRRHARAGNVVAITERAR